MRRILFSRNMASIVLFIPAGAQEANLKFKESHLAQEDGNVIMVQA